MRKSPVTLRGVATGLLLSLSLSLRRITFVADLMANPWCG
jgi:hypothetical protein